MNAQPSQPQYRSNTAKIAEPFQLVVGIDFSERSGFALDQAATIARSIPRSRLHVLHVDENDADSRARVTQLAGQVRLYVEEKLIALGEARGATEAWMNGQMLGVHVRQGSAVRELAQFVSDVRANLLIIGAHRAHLRHPFRGELATELTSSLDTPVLIVSPPAAPRESAHDVAIEPPCIACTERRFETSGKTWWCDRHEMHHQEGRAYSYQREFPFATHDSSVIPTGV